MENPTDHQMNQDYSTGQLCSTESQHDKDIQCMAGTACREPGCSCSSFVVLDKHNSQWCENCGHLRSKHVSG